MTITKTFGLCALLFCTTLVSPAQTNTAQQLAFAGLRTLNQQGQFNAVQSDSSSNLYLLLDQKDGVRILKTDNTASNILAQALLGAVGDVGTALALDPSGYVYVTGTTTSTTLTATSGSAIPSRTDTSTNSFVAKFDTNLNQQFVTFTGGSRIAASAIAVTSDAVFITGITYATNLPVTSNGIQQTPALGSSENGFLEKFSTDGSTLLYATYLTGTNGNTTPTAIASDASDNAYIAGSTSATGFPTVAALVPAILSNPSGFLTKLDAGGDTITASTFIPGAGLTSIALDNTGQTLLVSGSIALGQFPVATVATTLIPTTYQVLVRMPLSLAAVTSSTLIGPGTQSSVAVAANGAAWVDGVTTQPIFPLTPLSSLGSGFAVRVNATNTIDQTARFGGLPNGNPTFASLPAIITSIAVDPAGEPVIVGAMQPTASSSLLATQTYDLPLRNAPTTVLPSVIADAELTTATCNGSLCAGSAAYLAKLSPISSPALTFSAGDLPTITLRNLGSADANNLTLSATNATISTNCGTTLVAGGECNVLLSGSTAGTLTASASNGGTQTISFGTYSAPSSAIAFYPKELDFGIVTFTSTTATRIVTVSNLGTTNQTFTSAIDSNIKGYVSPFTEVASDCTTAGSVQTKLLAPGGTCHITIGFTAYSAATRDGTVQADWSIGARTVMLTAYSQAASLSVSVTEVDFGTQYTNGLRLPRYLYLSNASTSSITHAALTLPNGSPFTLTDSCPATLLANTVCQIRIDYLSALPTSNDSQTLTLDNGLSVLLTGQTLPPHVVGGATVNPNLSVTPASLTFSSPVVVTSVSGNAQNISITNTGASTFSLALAITGDFTDVTSCGTTLAAGATCAVAITFAPSQPGTRTGMLSITAGTGTSAATIALSGTGTSILPANNGLIAFGSVPVNQPVTQFYKVAQPFSSLSVTTTGPYTVTLVADAGYGPGTPPASAYAASVTAACPDCYLGIRFTPASSGSQNGTVTFTSTTGGLPYMLALTGSGEALSGLVLTPAVQDFGSVPVNSSSGAMGFTLTNLVTAGTTVVLTGPTTTGDFSVVSTTCRASLAYTASCAVQLAFVPTTTGARTGSLTFTTTSGSASASLTGSGVVDPGVAINPLALTFDNVAGTRATQQSVTVTNTGSTTVQVGAPAVTTTSFTETATCGALVAGASCSIAVTFQPGSAMVTDTLSIPVTTTGSTPQTEVYAVALSGSYTSSSAGIAITPALANYGPTGTGTQGLTQQFTITNSTARSYVLSLNLPHQYVLEGAPCAAVGSGQSCSFSLAFLPLTNGDIPGTILAQATPSDGSATLTSVAYVEGYGVGQGTLTLTGGLIVNQVYSFGQVASGQTVTQVFTLTNSSTIPITVRRVTSGPPFLSTTTCGAALATGQSCTVTVTYTPSNQVASGSDAPATTTDAGTLMVESDATSSPMVVNLTGQAGPVLVAAPTNPARLATFTLSGGSLTFPSTMVGDASAPQGLTFTNTGTQAIHVTAVTATADFTVQNGCSTVVAGASCGITVTSTPQTAGTHVAALEISSDAATSLEFVSLLSTATPSPLVIAPSSYDFGSLQLGSSSVLAVQVANTGATPIAFASVAASGDYVAAGSCPSAGASLAGNSSCTVQVTFAPTATGTRTGVLSLATSASTIPLTVALTGVGTQSKLLVTPSSLAFGSVAVGYFAELQLTLMNTGSAALTNIGLGVTGDYLVSIPCGTAVLAPGASCVVQVTFTPTVAGARGGTLTVMSSDASSPDVVPLTGTGIGAGGSFLLSVASASATAVSGQPATYNLTVTPTGGFAGTVALTCTPVVAAQYASCSLLPSNVTFANVGANGAQSSVVTVNTVTSVVAALEPNRAVSGTFFCLLGPCVFLVWKDRKRLRKHRLLLAALFFCGSMLFTTGCGSKGDLNIRYTPEGSYQFQISASSTSGVPITQTVTLSLVVTPR